MAEHERNTRLREVRLRMGYTQPAMAKRANLPLRTYQRLEAGELRNPPIRHVVNCALALGLRIQDVAEPEWIRWTTSPASPEPPESELGRERLAATIRAETDSVRPNDAAW